MSASLKVGDTFQLSLSYANLPSCIFVVSEVVQTLQLCADRDQLDVVGDLSVCLDGMTVDPEMFAAAEADHHSESQQSHEQDACRPVAISTAKKKNTVLVLSKTRCREESALFLRYHFLAAYSSRMRDKQAKLGFTTLTLDTRFLSLFDWFCYL